MSRILSKGASQRFQHAGKYNLIGGILVSKWCCHVTRSCFCTGSPTDFYPLILPQLVNRADNNSYCCENDIFSFCFEHCNSLTIILNINKKWVIVNFKQWFQQWNYILIAAEEEIFFESFTDFCLWWSYFYIIKEFFT